MRNYFLIAAVIAISSYAFYASAGSNSALVEATAYNSVKSQTNSNPTLTAWGDTLKPGMKAIAVSPDLIKLGLNYKTKVTIEGLSGTYLVLDRTNRRWTKRIDIYMGNDIQAAKEWGKRKVKINW